MKKPWSGRFGLTTDEMMVRFSSSIDFDQRLYPYDIEGSIAHCRTLAKCKIIKKSEADKIIAGLGKILKEFDAGKFKCDVNFEDIHMNIEARLIQIVGPVGGKLHTARSRNDQVCMETRLYLRAEIGEIRKLIAQLSTAAH